MRILGVGIDFSAAADSAKGRSTGGAALQQIDWADAYLAALLNTEQLASDDVDEVEQMRGALAAIRERVALRAAR